MNVWHVLNRGVEERDIVLDDEDRRRFVANLYAMNDSKAVDNMNYYFWRARFFNDITSAHSLRDRNLLVHIHGWCLMDNHFHILLSELGEGTIGKFLMKLNAGYAKYFNEKYKRSGTLFQGRTKKKLINNDAYFLWILHYIHFNPLDYFKKAGDWRTQRLNNPTGALDWLRRYRWSSFRDYDGIGDMAEILSGSFMFKDRGQYSKESKRYLSSLKDESLAPFYLEL